MIKLSPSCRRRHWIVLLALFLAVLVLQGLSGSWTSELMDPDEPAHFVSGLLVRDYIAGGLGSSPIEFARDYYSHYPKVAIGNWPPVFYGIQGVWMLVFPAHPLSVLLLLGLLTSALGWLVFRMLCPVIGTAHAAFGAGLLILLRPVPTYAGMVMIENALALMTTVALLLWVRHLERGGIRDLVAFGAMAGVAAMTKGNALFLVLLPPFAVGIGGRWDALRSRGIWLAALPVVLLAVPWTWYFLGDVVTGWRGVLPSAEHMSSAVTSYATGLRRSIGLLGTALFAIGLWVQLVRGGARQSTHAALWVSAAGLLAAVVLFHLLVPADIGMRHLIPAYPAIVMFLAAGAHHCTCWLGGRGLGRKTASAIVLCSAALAFGVEAFMPPTKNVEGYRTAALIVLEHTGADQASTSLIVSDAQGEGAFIVEVAIRDRHRPRHVVWRATNLLSLATWAGRGYQLRADGDDDVVRLLEQAAIRFVVMDRAFKPLPHQRQLERVIQGNPDRFILLAELPLRRGRRTFPDGLAVYEVLPGPGAAAEAPTIRQVPGYDGVEALGRR